MFTRGFVLLAFLGGIALGAWAMRFYFNHTLMAWTPAHRFIQLLDQDLNLSADQRGEVAGILAGQRAKMEDLRGLWKTDVRYLDRDGEDQIARLLTPAQMDVFMRKHDEIHGRMDRFLWAAEAGPTALAVAPGTP
jgi:hypothetical protein